MKFAGNTFLRHLAHKRPVALVVSFIFLAQKCRLRWLLGFDQNFELSLPFDLLSIEQYSYIRLNLVTSFFRSSLLSLGKFTMAASDLSENDI